MTTDPRQELLDDVLSRTAGMKDARQKELLEAAVRHLHSFADEVGLTRDEWMAGILFLTATGQMCDDVRQEFILLSDTLGVSSLVEMITYDGVEGSTENTVLGPFFVPGSRDLAAGDTIVIDEGPGEPVHIHGRVTDPDGNPVGNALLEVWQTWSNGLYAVQDPEGQDSQNCRGRFRTDADGNYSFRTIRPSDYPIPSDGPVGKMLAAAGRDVIRAGHVHVMVITDGFKTLITHVFDGAGKYLHDDAVFGVRSSLIRDFDVRNADGEADVTFDVVLVPN